MQVSQALRAAPAPAPSPAASSGGGLISGFTTRSSSRRNSAAATYRRLLIISAPGARGLLPRRLCSTPAAKIDNEDPLAMAGERRTALLRGTRLKRWVLRSSSNSEQGRETLEEKNIQSSEENKSGPPVLTIIAGLLVLFVVFWALSSLVSWIVGLIFRNERIYRAWRRSLSLTTEQYGHIWTLIKPEGVRPRPLVIQNGHNHTFPEWIKMIWLSKAALELAHSQG